MSKVVASLCREEKSKDSHNLGMWHDLKCHEKWRSLPTFVQICCKSVRKLFSNVNNFLGHCMTIDLCFYTSYVAPRTIWAPTTTDDCRILSYKSDWISFVFALGFCLSFHSLLTTGHVPFQVLLEEYAKYNTIPWMWCSHILGYPTIKKCGMSNILMYPFLK